VEKNAAGLSTFCAKAAAPTDLQQQQLNVLKMIAAMGGTTMKPGVTKTLLDMIVETNESFDRMVGSGFPRKTSIVKQPVHACMGEMKIVGGGTLSLREAAVGTAMVFYDVTKAEEEGYFGKDPNVGKEAEFTSLIELLSVGLCSSPAEWVNMRWTPSVWMGPDKKCTKSQAKTLESLAIVVANASPVAQSALMHPVFTARDIFGDKESHSGSSTATTSNKQEPHILKTKQMLTAIVKAGTSGQEANKTQYVKTNLKKPTTQNKAEPGMGKNAVRNARRRANGLKG
jgi:hypothetical protein